MAPRAKRTHASSRRQQRSAQFEPAQPQPTDLLSFDEDATTQPPSVFELEAPPSDPELGCQSTVIRDDRTRENLLAEPISTAQQ